MKPRRRENGSWYCQPIINGKRRMITLGKVNATDARWITGQIEKLISYKKKGFPVPASLHQWLKSLDSSFRKLLMDAGIIDATYSITFGQLLDLFLDDFRDGTRQPNTEKRIERSTRTARQYFGKLVVSEISQGDIERFEKALKRRFTSEATWTKSLRDTKQVFRWGVSKKLIEENPIQFLKGGSMSNDARMEYVDADTITEVIDICEGDWILIFALARFTGLRVPSEFYRLRWRDVNWDKETIQIYGVKTKQWRICPIFPPLNRYLSDAWEKLPDGTPAKSHIIQAEQRRRLESNLRSQALDFIDRAGVDRWPKLFVNLRMSCATDLLDHYPVQKVASWLGHSVKILLQHYHGTSGKEIEVARKQTGNPFLVKQ